MNFSDRLRLFCQKHNIYGKDIAVETDMAPNTISSYMTGKSSPTVEWVERFCTRYGCYLAWLCAGVGTMDGLTTITNNDVVMIPRYSVRASAGNGANVLNEEPIGYMAFMREWIDRHELDATALFVIGITGDSMEGKLYANDSILVNRKIHDISGGSVYVFRQDNDLLIKYLQRMPGDVLRVSSENQAYPSYDIDMNIHADSVEIIGQVAVSMHSWI